MSSLLNFVLSSQGPGQRHLLLGSLLWLWAGVCFWYLYYSGEKITLVFNFVDKNKDDTCFRICRLTLPATCGEPPTLSLGCRGLSSVSCSSSPSGTPGRYGQKTAYKIGTVSFLNIDTQLDHRCSSIF